MEPTTASPNPPLYSAQAIRIFSILFSAIVGGVLTAQNFKAVGRFDAARKALWGSIIYTVLVLIAVSYLPERASNSSTIGVVTGLIGGLALTAYSDKVIPQKETFPKKKIWKPLLICLLIFIPLIGLIIYFMSLQS
ncbi:hypothetical protein [Hymenobacter sp. BT730]|uniref:hypothetical protein n=1 Tax=Hymenobacter sp. BT730 TaxID=3063332 RepID=UPI0026DF45E8|nr:hypothetical protein [Hymenobacter sp. BT730]